MPRKTSPHWAPSACSVYLGEFEGRDLYATEAADGRVEFVAVSDGGIAASSEGRPSPPLSEVEELELYADLCRTYPDMGPYEPSPVEECKRRWWATQPPERLVLAITLADAQRAVVDLWRKRRASREGEA